MATSENSAEEKSQTARADRVLVIDDELELLRALSGTLRGAGYAVRTAHSAERGLTLLEQEPAELVITDIIMPRKSGLDVIAKVRELYPGTRVIAMSGCGDFGLAGYRRSTGITTSAYLDASERAGAHAVLAKPFEAEQILTRVREVLDAPLEQI